MKKSICLWQSDSVAVAPDKIGPEGEYFMFHEIFGLSVVKVAIRRSTGFQPVSGDDTGRIARATSGYPSLHLCYYPTMKTHSLDILKKAELPPAQPHAIFKVMELEIASAHESLATKADILETKADILELRAEMKAIEGTLSRWVLTCILGQPAVLAGLGYFFLAHFGR